MKRREEIEQNTHLKIVSKLTDFQIVKAVKAAPAKFINHLKVAFIHANPVYTRSKIVSIQSWNPNYPAA